MGMKINEFEAKDIRQNMLAIEKVIEEMTGKSYLQSVLWYNILNENNLFSNVVLVGNLPVHLKYKRIF